MLQIRLGASIPHMFITSKSYEPFSAAINRDQGILYVFLRLPRTVGAEFMDIMLQWSN